MCRGDSVERVDLALEAFLATPSSNAKDFGEKLTALVSDNLDANLLRKSVNHRDLR